MNILIKMDLRLDNNISRMPLPFSHMSRESRIIRTSYSTSCGQRHSTLKPSCHFLFRHTFTTLSCIWEVLTNAIQCARCMHKQDVLTGLISQMFFKVLFLISRIADVNVRLGQDKAIKKTLYPNYKLHLLVSLSKNQFEEKIVIVKKC